MLTLTTQYSKKCGLPGYSSISGSASLDVELHDLDSLPSEIARLYRVLQESVDAQLKEHIGFVPTEGYGHAAMNGNGHLPTNGNGNGNDATPVVWKCSDKQCQLIGELSGELRLSDAELDARSERLFNKPARLLDKLGASGLISDLLADAGKRRQRAAQANGNGSHGRRHSEPHRNGGGA